MVKHFCSSGHCIWLRQYRLIKSHVYTFSIFFEVPVLMTVSVFAKYTRSNTDLEGLFIYLIDS